MDKDLHGKPSGPAETGMSKALARIKRGVYNNLIDELEKVVTVLKNHSEIVMVTCKDEVFNIKFRDPDGDGKFWINVDLGWVRVFSKED